MNFRVLYIFGVGVAAACSSASDRTPTLPDNPPSTGGNPVPAPVASVSVTPTPANGMVGQTVQLAAQTKDANGNTLTGRTIAWASSDLSIATVASSGLLTLVAPGTAVVSAVSEGKSGQADVSVVKPPVSTVAVTPTTASGTVGQTAQLTAVVRDASGSALTDRAVAWTSSNTAVASVTGSGLVTMGGVGSASITATSEGISGRADVSVARQPVASVGVTPATASGTVGQTAQLTAVVRDASGSALMDRAVTWTSSNTAIASVTGSGLVTMAAVGSASITATSEGISGQADINVARQAVASVGVTPATASGTVGQTAQLTAVIRDASGAVLTNRTVTWTSSNTAIASVNASGLVAMVAVGTASITATTEGISGRADVSVTKVPVATVAVTPATASGTVGQTAQFTAVVRDMSGAVVSDRAVAWTSSNGAVASVNGSGLVTMVGGGTASITATSEGISGRADVTVAKVPVATVAVTPPATAALVGQTAQLTAVVRDASGTVLSDRAVAWTSSNTAVASVSGTGLVTMLAAGTASITATSEGVSGRADVSIVKPPVATVAVTPATASGTVGQTAQLTAVVRDASGAVLSDRAVTWTTSNTAVVSVNGSGLATMIGVGTASITATSETKSGSANVTVTAVPPPPTGNANECATPRSGWVFCDDFETDRLSRYFEYDNAGGKFARVTSSGFGGSVGMRATFTPGQSNAGALHAALGRTPSSYFRPVDAGTANYRELYWRVLVRRETGWVGNGPGKLTRATSFAKADWSQSMIAHIWTSSSDSKFLMIDPASGTDGAGNVITSGYNDFAHLQWIGAAQSAAPEEDQAHVGQWACYEFHVKLNDAGQSNGLFELSVNGSVSARKTGLNWVGSYAAYGINAVFLENFQNEGAPAANVRTFDNFVISTQPIGCVQP